MNVVVERMDDAAVFGHAVVAELDGVLTEAYVAAVAAAANAAVIAGGAIADDVIVRGGGPVAADAENDGADFVGEAEGVDSVTDAVVDPTVVAVVPESAG